jgi:hypothetical protein
MSAKTHLQQVLLFATPNHQPIKTFIHDHNASMHHLIEWLKLPID